MQNSFFQAICRIGIFMICVRAIIYFRPNESYEKYLRLLAGILIMIQLFLPVGRLLLGRGGQEAAQVLQQFRQELERGMEEAAESAAAADALLEQMTLEEIQRRMEEQASRENREEDPEYGEENLEDKGEDPKYVEENLENRGEDPEYGEENLEDRGEDPEYGGKNAEDGGERSEKREENPGGADESGEGIAVRVEEIELISIGPLHSEAE